MADKRQEPKVSKNHDIMAEAFILSCIFEKPDIFMDIQRLITSANVFYSENNHIIYDAMVELYYKDIEIDIIMVINSMKIRGTLNSEIKEYVTKLNDKIPGDISTYKEKINVIIDKWKIRQTERMTDRIKKITSTGKCTFSAIKEITEDYAYLEESFGNNPKTVLQILKLENENNLEYIRNGETQKYMGVMSSFKSLRKYLVYRRKNITILAARPGHGKTSLALKEAYWQACNGYRVAYFTLEVGEMECVTKLICMEYKMQFSEYEALKLEQQNRLNETFMNKLMDLKNELIIVDYAFSWQEIISEIKVLQKTKQLDAVYIDYVQLSESNNFSNNRNQQLSTISRMFKKYCSKMNFAGIFLSQLNRNCELRDDKRPILADLRDSGALEQDTSIAVGLYNGELYDDENSIPGEVEIIFLKSRYGPIGRKKLGFAKEYMLFHDLQKKESKPDKPKEIVKKKNKTYKPNFKISNASERKATRKKEKQGEIFTDDTAY